MRFVPPANLPLANKDASSETTFVLISRLATLMSLYGASLSALSTASQITSFEQYRFNTHYLTITMLSASLPFGICDNL